MLFNSGCKTLGGAMRVGIGPSPKWLAGDCAGYYNYAVNAAATSTDTTITFSGATPDTDNTTIDKSNHVMNIANCPETGEIILAYDKTLVTTFLATVEAKRGFSLLKEKYQGNELTNAQALSTSDNIRFNAEWDDFFSPNWYWYKTRESVEVSFENEFDDRDTNEDGIRERYYGMQRINFTMRLPLNLSPKFMRGVIGFGYPTIVDDDNATPADKLYQAVYSVLIGRSVPNVSVILMPLQTAYDPNAKTTTGEIKLNDAYIFPKVALAQSGSQSWGVGEQVVLELECTALFDDATQCCGLFSPMAWRGADFPSET